MRDGNGRVENHHRNKGVVYPFILTHGGLLCKMKGAKWPQLRKGAEVIELPSLADKISTAETSASE